MEPTPNKQEQFASKNLCTPYFSLSLHPSYSLSLPPSILLLFFPLDPPPLSTLPVWTGIPSSEVERQKQSPRGP